LFLAKNSDLLNSQVKNLWLELLKYYNIPSSYLYIFEDNGEKIKIKDISKFIELSNSKPPYKFQIFLIENISRFTISAWNSLLKFFEEPDVTNIIFLTNNSENWILDTILSRVQTINLWWISKIKKDDFIYSLINNYFRKKDTEILSYYFRNKLEKEEYINFLENLIIYSKENLVFIDFLEKIDEDINAIKQNNVNAKYIVDKWLLKI
jgi:replication-associated recombination protein RarA